VFKTLIFVFKSRTPWPFAAGSIGGKKRPASQPSTGEEEPTASAKKAQKEKSIEEGLSNFIYLDSFFYEVKKSGDQVRLGREVEIRYM